MLLLSSADFSKLSFSKNSFGITVIASKDLNPNQERRFLGLDLGQNRLQRSSADDKIRP